MLFRAGSAVPGPGGPLLSQPTDYGLREDRLGVTRFPEEIWGFYMKHPEFYTLPCFLFCNSLGAKENIFANQTWPWVGRL